MHHAKITLVAAAALMLTVPATATWSTFGSYEPDTPYDDASWMWADPAAPGESKVYFSVISSTQYVTVNGKPSFNPNVALLQTQIEPFGLERQSGYLGIWADCNGDGYVGAFESGLREYSAELLASDAVCPGVTGPANSWVAGAHNYNGWVSEFIPIVRSANPADRRTIADEDARVWGDFGRPDEKPFFKTCPLYPFPRGTFHNTGGLINYFDCRSDTLQVGILENWNSIMTSIGDPAGLTFSDANDARTGALGQHQLGGDEDDSNTPVTIWDCSDQTRVGDEANKTAAGPLLPPVVHNSRVAGLDIGAGDTTSPTPTGFVNHTKEGIMVGGLDDCDTSNDFGHDVYTAAAGLPETDFNGVDPNNKREANWNFAVEVMPRGQALLASQNPLFGQSGIPADGGLSAGGTRYLGDSTRGSKPGPGTLRVDLQNGQVGPAAAYWLSFYARVGTNTTNVAALPGGEDTYGKWACGENKSGIHNGWNCDVDQWYLNPDGSAPNDPTGILAKPGMRIDLRDVDCYDGRIGNTGVGVLPAYYGNDPCPSV